jgi:glucose-1-phosphate cytidylyltransferase
MLPIGGYPILWHIMKGYAHYGYKRFVLCLCYKGWLIKRYFLDDHLQRADLSVHLAEPRKIHVHTPVDGKTGTSRWLRPA